MNLLIKMNITNSSTNFNSNKIIICSLVLEYLVPIVTSLACHSKQPFSCDCCYPHNVPVSTLDTQFLWTNHHGCIWIFGSCLSRGKHCTAITAKSIHKLQNSKNYKSLASLRTAKVHGSFIIIRKKIRHHAIQVELLLDDKEIG